MNRYFFLLLCFLGIISGQKCFANSSQACEKNWYVGGFGSINFLDLFGQGLHDPGYRVGGSIGRRFAHGFRLEGEVSYHRYKIQKSYFRESSATWTYMANVLYDFDLGTSFTPYIGAGAGYADTSLNFKHEWFQYKWHGSRTGFVYQGIAGLSYAISNDTNLGLEYRYLKEKNGIRHDHGIGLSLRYSL